MSNSIYFRQRSTVFLPLKNFASLKIDPGERKEGRGKREGSGRVGRRKMCPADMPRNNYTMRKTVPSDMRELSEKHKRISEEGEVNAFIH